MTVLSSEQTTFNNLVLLKAVTVAAKSEVKVAAAMAAATMQVVAVMVAEAVMAAAVATVAEADADVNSQKIWPRKPALELRSRGYCAGLSLRAQRGNLILIGVGCAVRYPLRVKFEL